MAKKVLFVITKSVWGGAQTYVFDLATSLPKTDFDVAVAAGGSGILFEKLEEAGIKTAKIKYLTKNINLLREIFSVISLFKIFNAEHPDIIHLNSSKTGGLGAVAALLYKLKTKSKAKTIFTVHGWAFNEDRSFPAKILIFLSQWMTAFLCDKVIVISKHDYRQALKMPLVKQEKFALIPLGIAFPNNNFMTKEKSRKLISKMIGDELAKDDIVIGAISELTPNKGLGYLIDAVRLLKKSLPSIKCVIVGDGEERSAMRDKINSMELGTTVYLTGFVKNANSYLRGFDAFALPSLKEGLPYVLMEAMSAGLPIAATSVGGVPDLIEHQKNGFLAHSKSHASFAEAIEKTLASSIKSVKNAHAEKLQNHFSLDKMATNTMKIYSG